MAADILGIEYGLMLKDGCNDEVNDRTWQNKRSGRSSGPVISACIVRDEAMAWIGEIVKKWSRR
jgi:hypothetical protein